MIVARADDQKALPLQPLDGRSAVHDNPRTGGMCGLGCFDCSRRAIVALLAIQSRDEKTLKGGYPLSRAAVRRRQREPNGGHDDCDSVRAQSAV